MNAASTRRALAPPAGTNQRRLRAGRVIASVVLATAAACGGADDKSARTPSGARASCEVDSDCVVTDKGHCCAPCLEAPHAIPVLAFEQQKSRCAAVDCSPPSDRIECPKVEPKEEFVAKCSHGTCAAVRAH